MDGAAHQKVRNPRTFRSGGSGWHPNQAQWDVPSKTLMCPLCKASGIDLRPRKGAPPCGGVFLEVDGDHKATGFNAIHSRNRRYASSSILKTCNSLGLRCVPLVLRPFGLDLRDPRSQNRLGDESLMTLIAQPSFLTSPLQRLSRSSNRLLPSGASRGILPLLPPLCSSKNPHRLQARLRSLSKRTPRPLPATPSRFLSASMLQ